MSSLHVVDFYESHSGAASSAPNDRGVIAGWQCGEDRRVTAAGSKLKCAQSCRRGYDNLEIRRGFPVVIRTAGNPLRSRPSLALTATTIAVVMAGIVIPFTSLGKTLGFVRLPFAFFLFLAGASGTYLLLVELVKRRLMRRLLG